MPPPIPQKRWYEKAWTLELENLPFTNRMTCVRSLSPLSPLQNGVIVPILWVGARIKGDDAVCRAPAQPRVPLPGLESLLSAPSAVTLG